MGPRSGKCHSRRSPHTGRGIFPNLSHGPLETGGKGGIARLRCTGGKVVAPRVRCVTVQRGVSPRFIQSRMTEKQTVVPSGVGRPRARPVVVKEGFRMGVGTGVKGSTISSSVRRRMRGVA